MKQKQKNCTVECNRNIVETNANTIPLPHTYT
jgi:hypothetical protein